MIVIVTFVGLMLGIAMDTWIPFGISVVIAAGMQWATTTFLHQHMHKLYEGEDDDHGIKTID